MPAPEKILQLVERFETHLADYKRSTYNEKQTRREFIDPFFQALAWDVDNSQGKEEKILGVINLFKQVHILFALMKSHKLIVFY